MTLRRFLPVLLGGVLGFALMQLTPLGVVHAQGVEKVTICHFTNSRTNPYNTISIPAPLLPSHLSHGDLVGACEDLCNRCLTDGNECTTTPCVIEPFGIECAAVECEDGEICVPASGCSNTNPPNCGIYDAASNTMSDNLCTQCQALCSGEFNCLVGCVAEFGCRKECQQ